MPSNLLVYDIIFMLQEVNDIITAQQGKVPYKKLVKYHIQELKQNQINDIRIRTEN